MGLRRISFGLLIIFLMVAISFTPTLAIDVDVEDQHIDSQVVLFTQSLEYVEVLDIGDKQSLELICHEVYECAEINYIDQSEYDNYIFTQMEKTLET